MSIGNSPEEDRPSVGRALQQARIDAQLTVEDVSRSTRVRAPIVQAIEQDDFARCGGAVYARGHVRTLARAVGMDAAALVERFDSEHGGKPAPTPTVPVFETTRIRSEPRSPNWTAAMVAAIVAVVGFVGFTLVSGGDSADGDSVADKAPTEQSTSGTTSPPPAPPAEDSKPEPSDSAIAAAPADKVTVKLVVEDGTSWISATNSNGGLEWEGVLLDGDTRTFVDDEQIDLVLGNAGAVKLFVNGKEVDKVGGVGEVERLTYTQGDPEAG